MMTSTILAAFPVSNVPVFTMANPLLQGQLIQMTAFPGNKTNFDWITKTLCRNVNAISTPQKS